MQYQKKRSILYKKFLEQNPQNVAKIEEPEEVHKENDFEDICVLIRGFFRLIKNLIFIFLCISILVLASVGATVMFNGTLRELFLSTVLASFI